MLKQICNSFIKVVYGISTAKNSKEPKKLNKKLNKATFLADILPKKPAINPVIVVPMLAPKTKAIPQDRLIIFSWCNCCIIPILALDDCIIKEITVPRQKHKKFDEFTLTKIGETVSKESKHSK